MSKPNSVIIDGVEYIRAEHVPSIGILSYVKEVFGFNIYMTKRACEYVYGLPGSTFIASNGFAISCDNYSSTLTETTLNMKKATFWETSVDLQTLFGGTHYDKYLTKKTCEALQIALKELAAQVPQKIPKNVNTIPSGLESY